MDFYEVDDQLAAAGALGSPAELQGMLCGRLSGGALAEADLLSLAAEFLSLEERGLGEIAGLVLAMYNDLHQQLCDGQWGLRLLLPEDDEDMSRRLGALADWCQGYLVGLGQGGIADAEQLLPEIHEILQDLAAIAQVDDQAEMAVEDEQDESDYAELVEYVRVVALTVSETLSGGQPKQTSQPVLH